MTPEKDFPKLYPTYEAYHEAVVAALVRAYGEHTEFFFARRHTYRPQFAERKTPLEVVDSYRQEYGGA